MINARFKLKMQILNFALHKKNGIYIDLEAGMDEKCFAQYVV